VSGRDRASGLGVREKKVKDHFMGQKTQRKQGTRGRGVKGKTGKEAICSLEREFRKSKNARKNSYAPTGGGDHERRNSSNVISGKCGEKANRLVKEEENPG